MTADFGREEPGWICTFCQEDQHCDGATVQCDCTCTWPEDWAEAEAYKYEPPPRADRGLEDLTWAPTPEEDEYMARHHPTAMLAVGVPESTATCEKRQVKP